MLEKMNVNEGNQKLRKKYFSLLQEYYKWYYSIMYSVVSSLITVITI